MKDISFLLPLAETPKIYEPVLLLYTSETKALNAATALLWYGSLPQQGKHPKSLTTSVKAPFILLLKQALRAQGPGLRDRARRV